MHDIRTAADAWFARLLEEEEPPNEEQQPIIRHVIEQVIHEEADPDCQASEPIIELVHGEPGAGKRHFLKRVVRFFTAVL